MICFELEIISDANQSSLKIKSQLLKILAKNKIKKPQIIIVIGGDGFMLKTIKKSSNNRKSKHV